MGVTNNIIIWHFTMINDKIRNILLMKDLSPSRFADEIGVQRSSISHILSGRNKASLDVVQKIVRRFPELGFDWIVEEDEEADELLLMNEAPQQSANGYDKRKDTGKAAVKAEANLTENLPPVRTIERILIFYTDKTFSEYHPGA